jgi:hypothetical protein
MEGSAYGDEKSVVEFFGLRRDDCDALRMKGIVAELRNIAAEK